MKFFSYAQNFEDVLLWRALGHIDGGFYIDLGASHPDLESVTRAFYERGWNGINVEPVEKQFLRLCRSRLRDINLRLAIGAAAGVAKFFVVDESGLSTLDPDLARSYERLDLHHQTLEVPVETLAEICRRHVRSDIHFLKIDVEGAERDALAGADFNTFRPWIVLVEATRPTQTIESHLEWEFLLTAADYRFVWFDGLNRFYVARERHDALGRHFHAPPNVFDDFVRAADTEWAAPLARARDEHAALLRRWEETEARLAEARSHARATENALTDALRAANAESEGLRAETSHLHAEADRLRADMAELDRARLNEIAELRRLRDELAGRNDFLDVAAERGRVVEERAKAMHASTSWRVTAPLRNILGLAGRGASDPLAHLPPAPVLSETVPVFEDTPEPPSPSPPPGEADAPPPPGQAAPPPPGQAAPAILLIPTDIPPKDVPPVDIPIGSLPADPWPAEKGVAVLKRSIHQFHSGCAKGDAITNAMLMGRDLLRGLGYRSEVFFEWPDPALGHQARPLAELPRHGEYVLIAHHSSGYGAFDHIHALPAPKVLIYHNITPSELMPESQRYWCDLGRAQLARWRGHVAATLADSEFNAIELRALGFENVHACMMLFDLDAMRARAETSRESHPSPRGGADGRTFTILFVGRVTPSKGQDALIEAFALFREQWRKPCALVLIGRQEKSNDPYLETLQERIVSAGLEQDVILTGLVSDADRDAWYQRADLYVSLSHHEGFGVPLIEAAAHGLPVVATAEGAVPYTLGGMSEALLTDRSPGAVAAVLLAFARDPRARADLAVRQQRFLDRFRLDHQLPKLLRALALAGAASPPDPESRALLAANLHFTVTGHVNGSYSLATVNRALVLALENHHPGHARVVPVEGRPTQDLTGVPAAERETLAMLARRPPPVSGPHVILSHHYPLYTRSGPADATLAIFFWEESVVPPSTVAALNSNFRGILAASRFVAKVLIDSGVSLPVHVIGHCPDLRDFQAIGERRSQNPGARSEAPFTFLHVSSCFPRKGVDVLLAAWALAFGRGDRVRLVIKGFPNPHNDVEERLAAARRAHPDLAEITCINRDCSRDELLRLYENADAMVLPTRGEGFNIPAAEAMAAGLALLTTGGGGGMDFHDESNATLIDFRFALSASHLRSPLSLWMEPDPEDLARKMRAQAGERGREEGKVEKARRDIARVADPEAWARRITEAALDLLLAPPREALRIAWVSTWSVRCGVAEYSRNLLEAMPWGPDIGGITVLCDTRTDPGPGGLTTEGKNVRARPAWRVGMADGVAALAEAIAREDPHVAVIQHQPGLIPWEALAALLKGPDLAGRRVVITLHSTWHLLDINPEARHAVLHALRGVDRVLVHTVGDLNFLRDQGLSDTVTLMPHGVRAPGRAQAARPITPASTPVIGCYGFFLRGKGIPQLIAAMTIIHRTFPNARLRLVNADYGSPDSAAEIAFCRLAVAAAGLENSVAFHTDFLSHEDSMALLAECDVVALPYQASRESSSAALRSALCAGVPVAVTPLSLFDEAGEAVIRLPGLDSAALASGLLALLSDARERMDSQIAARYWLDERERGGVAKRLKTMLLGLTALPRALPRSDDESSSSWNAAPHEETSRAWNG